MTIENVNYTNRLAENVANSANRYLNKYRHLGDFVQRDYEDLISIANLIQSDAPRDVVAQAMRHLDTCVRDEIPDNVYYAFQD
jgi:hypothetical protein